MELRFCYRISAEAHMAYDIETSEPAAAYMQVKMDAEKLPEDYEKSQRVIGASIARQSGWKAEWVEPISTEEHDLQTVDDEDETDQRMLCPCGCGMDPCLES